MNYELLVCKIFVYVFESNLRHMHHINFVHSVWHILMAYPFVSFFLGDIYSPINHFVFSTTLLCAKLFCLNWSVQHSKGKEYKRNKNECRKLGNQMQEVKKCWMQESKHIHKRFFYCSSKSKWLQYPLKPYI